MKKKIVILVNLALIMLLTETTAIGELASEAKTIAEKGNVSVLSNLHGPKKLKITTYGLKAVLTWEADPSSYCSGYALYQCERSKTKPTNTGYGWKIRHKDGYYWYPVRQVGTTKDTSADIRVGQAGTYYLALLSYYKSPGKYISKSIQCTVFKASDTLTAPKNVTASQIAKNKVKLTWTAGNNAEYYEIFRRVGSSGKFLRIGRVKGLTFHDRSVKIGTSYQYKIQAVRGQNYKASSTLKIRPMKKPKIFANSPEDGKVVIQWIKLNDAKKYSVYQKGPEDSEFKLVTTTKKLIVNIKDGFTVSGVYKYYIVPINGSFTGLKSDTISVNVTVSPVYRAVLIGQTYTGHDNALPACGRDRTNMEGMLKTLKRTEYTTIENVNNGTTSEIWTAIENVFSQAKTSDVTLLYYSGHGAEGGTFEDRDFVSITAGALRKKLDTYKGKKVIIIDACYSGAMIGKADPANARGAAKQFNVSFVQAFRNAAKSSTDLADDGYYVITACAGNQLSWTHGNSSAFTRQFLIGLGWESIDAYMLQTMYADADWDGQVTLQEAYAYSREFVSSNYPDDNMDVQVYPVNCDVVFWAR